VKSVTGTPHAALDAASPEIPGQARNEGLVGKTVVRVSPDFYRPTDVVNLWGDPTKAKAKLGWNPAKTSFEELVKLMVEHDVAKVAAEGAAAKVRTNLAEYLEKGIVK
jgi:GDPmannose 4,6-dehydratase